MKEKEIYEIVGGRGFAAILQDSAKGITGMESRIMYLSSIKTSALAHDIIFEVEPGVKLVAYTHVTSNLLEGKHLINKVGMVPDNVYEALKAADRLETVPENGFEYGPKRDDSDNDTLRGWQEAIKRRLRVLKQDVFDLYEKS